MGLSVPFSIYSLILADLHILYATKQNKSQLPRDTFSGLKIAAKYVCDRGSAADPGGSLQRSPDSLAALGEKRRRGKDGREGEDRKGEEREQERGGKGRGEEEKGEGGRRGMNGPNTFWVKFTPLSIASTT